MIMSEKLHQNPLPQIYLLQQCLSEGNAAWFIRGGRGHMYSHVKKLYELSFSPVYSETTVRNGYMDRKYIERNSWYIYFLWIFTFSEFCKHITSIYIFRIFTKWAFPDYFVFHAPPPLFCNPVTVYRSSLNSEPPVSESDQKLVLMFTWKQVKKCSK